MDNKTVAHYQDGQHQVKFLMNDARKMGGKLKWSVSVDDGVDFQRFDDFKQANNFFTNKVMQYVKASQ